jgi:hypothetical protein
MRFVEKAARLRAWNGIDPSGSDERAHACLIDFEACVDSASGQNRSMGGLKEIVNVVE